MTAVTVTAPASPRALHDIARDIRRDWRKVDKNGYSVSNVWFGAAPYLEAMGMLGSVEDNFGYDSGRSVVRYFLANASTWRGPVAQAIKAELMAILK
jgi:hypothetical protein